MPSSTAPPMTDIGPSDMTGDQLARSTTRVFAETQYGGVTGGCVDNGCQVFLNVPYGRDVARWEDPQPLPRDYKYPADKEYVVDGLYCAQPNRAYTLQIPVRDRLGLGQPTENPFFADIYVPSDVRLDDSLSLERDLRPVRVFLHGGFLQFGSTSGQHYNQQFFAAEHYGEVRVLLGHRLSVLGFLGSEAPFVSGNFGFKDCWLGLQWIRDNIASFGGDPAQIHLSGLSGGAHLAHQLMHRVAYGAKFGERSPFASVMLQSNAILSDPLTRSDRADQFAAFARELGADPSSPTVLADLRDTAKYPTSALVRAVERMGTLGTFRGVVGEDGDGWVRANQMAYQRSGGLGRDLAAAGVKCVIVGDVRDEDHFYTAVHDVTAPDTLLPNVARYYPLPLARALLESYPPLHAGATPAECQARLGRVLADGQVHLPVRLLAADLAPYLPVVRYTIEMAPKALGYDGRVPHGADLPVQHLRLSVLSPDETKTALEWHTALEAAVAPALVGDGSFVQRGQEEVLALQKNGSTAWSADWRWPSLRAAEKALRGVVHEESKV